MKISMPVNIIRLDIDNSHRMGWLKYDQICTIIVWWCVPSYFTMSSKTNECITIFQGVDGYQDWYTGTHSVHTTTVCCVGFNNVTRCYDNLRTKKFSFFFFFFCRYLVEQKNQNQNHTTTIYAIFACAYSSVSCELIWMKGFTLYSVSL